MTSAPFTLIGRSSSHFTRIARIFALELGVPFTFLPVLDLTVVDPEVYAGNPALKVPVLVDEEGALYGTENLCRELALRSGRRAEVVLRGDVRHRTLANVEETVLHAMSAEVNLVMLGAVGPDAKPSPPKLRRSLENALAFLDAHIDVARAALPEARALSFVEVSLYCLVTHLPFRQVMDVAPYSRLAAFSAAYGQRPSARETEYRYDAG